MEVFLEEMLVILPILGVTAFEIPPASSIPRPDGGNENLGLGAKRLLAPATSIEPLYLRGSGGIAAEGAYRPEGFVVFEGATGRTRPVPSVHPFLVRIRDELARQGLLAADGELLRLTQHHVFDSPSTAAGVLLGRAANGRSEWKDAEGRTLKDLQEAALQAQPKL
jgi:hypothetical protein